MTQPGGSLALVVLGFSVALCSMSAQLAFADEITLTATSANVKESGSLVRMRIVRWSTDEERNPLIAALNPAAAVPAPARAGCRCATFTSGERGESFISQMKTVADINVLRSAGKKGRNDVHDHFIRYMLVVWPEIQCMQNVVIRAEKFHPSE